MSSHNHAPWRKAVLIPFWIIQLLFELTMIGLLGMALGVLVTWNDYEENGVYSHATETTAKIVVPIWIAVILLCLALTITEIVLLARHKLAPKMFVIMNTIKTSVFTTIFVLDIISAVDDNSRTSSIFGLVIESILYLSFLIPLIYGSIIYHRTRHTTIYAPVEDALAQPISYTPQYKSIVPKSDLENGAPGARRSSYYNPATATRFENKQHNRSVSYGESRGAGDIGLGGERGIGAYELDREADVGSPEIPTLVVEHHDEVYEMMDSRRSLR